MTSRQDDDALSWGDDDPTLDVGDTRADAAAPAPIVLPEGFRAVGKGSETLDEPADERADPAEPEDGPAQLSTTALLGIGVLAGIYLLYAIGWLIGGTRLHLFAIGAVEPPFYYAMVVLSVVAPIVWFATVYVLTRGAKTWLRFVWLIAGAVLLVPWPLLMVGPGA